MAFSADPARGLLIRPQPFRGEGLRGYFLRLADVNALLPNVDLYRKAFAGNGLNGVSRARLEEVARTFGLDFESLRGLGCQAMVADSTRCQYLGHSIAAQHLRGSQCAVCPRCLEACAAMRADWELVAQVVCPEHGCWLIDRCSRCGRPISWRRRGLRTCLCGQLLDQLCTRPADPVVVEYGRALARRLFGELEPLEGPASIPEAILSAPMNQLLGLFTLFRNSRLRNLQGGVPDLPTWSRRLRDQAATVLSVGSVLADWPKRWHDALGQVAEADLPASCGRRRIVSVEQARAPFAALHRVKWSAAADFPAVFRLELASFLRERAVRVGSRRYYAMGSRTQGKAATTTELPKLWSSARGAGSVSTEDLFSAEMVRDLFDATADQMSALQRVGILPKNREWFLAREVDAGFQRLTRRTCSRPRAESDDEFVPLWDLGLTDSFELEAKLRRVMTGEVPTVTWRHLRPAGFRNLFLRIQKNGRDTDQSPCATKGMS